MTKDEFLAGAVTKAYGEFVAAWNTTGKPPLTEAQAEAALVALAFGLAMGAGISIAAADEWRKQAAN